MNKSSDIEFVLSDNSQDEYKKEFCKKISSNNFNYLTSNAKNSAENALNAIKNSKGRFVLNLGDDDKIIKIGNFQVNNNEKDNVIGYRPNFAIWTEKYGITGLSNFSISSHPIRRVNEYFQKLMQIIILL